MPVPDDLLQAALSHAERGWHIFPLRPGDKRPAFPDHTGETCTGRDPRCRAAGQHVGWEPRATTDPDRIRRAWSRAPYNIGIACGPSRLVVVDLDLPKPDQHPPAEWDLPGIHDGADVFATLCEQAGQPTPGDTYTVTTGRGGTHHYYQHPDTGPDLRNTEGTTGNGLGWLVDTRAHGGYVVAAGSTVNGRLYTADLDTDPVPLPEWLTSRLQPAPLPPQQPVVLNLPTGRTGAYLRAAVDQQLQHLTNTPEGGRNKALYLSAIALGQLAAGSNDLTEEQAAGLLEAAAQRVGLGPTETRRTITSGLRAGAQRPRSVAA